MKSILLAEASVLRRAEISSVFDNCYHIIPAAVQAEVLPLAEEFMPDVLLICQEFAGADTLLLIEKIKLLVPRLNVIVISARGDMEFAMDALKAGAVTVLTGMPTAEVLFSSVAGKVPPENAGGCSDMPWKVKGC